MALVANCPHCGRQELVPLLPGANLLCPGCYSPFTLPGSEDVPAVPTANPYLRLVGHEADVNCAVFTPDGRCVISCSAGEIEQNADEPGPVLGSDYSIRVWERPTGREVQRLTQHTAAINSVAVSPDGRFILSGSDDGTARLWDAKSERELRRYEGHAQPVNCVAFSSSGRYALTGGYDRTVRVWEVAADQLHDLTRGRQLRCLEIEERSVWGGGRPHDLAFSPDTRHVAAGCNDFLLPRVPL